MQWASCVGWDSTLRIATGWMMPGSNPCGDTIFCTCFRAALRPTQPPTKWIPGLFPRAKAAGAWRWIATQYSPEVKERVELYLWFPSGTSWRAGGWTLSYKLTAFGKNEEIECEIRVKVAFNPLTPNDPYRGRTAPLTSKRCILYIQQIQVLNILNIVYTLRFFSSKYSLFHNSNVFGSCIIHILYTGYAKI